MNEWQPIETAPKDQIVLIWDKTYKQMYAAYYDKRYGKDCWTSNACIDDYFGTCTASHWQPLPEPPKEQD